MQRSEDDGNQFEQWLQRERAKEGKMQESYQIHALFEDDANLKEMRKGYPNYEAGEWDVARSVFGSTLHMLGESDGPSKALLDFMRQYGFDSKQVPPKGWLRYRELIET